MAKKLNDRPIRGDLARPIRLPDVAAIAQAPGGDLTRHDELRDREQQEFRERRSDKLRKVVVDFGFDPNSRRAAWFLVIALLEKYNHPGFAVTTEEQLKVGHPAEITDDMMQVFAEARRQGLSVKEAIAAVAEHLGCRPAEIPTGINARYRERERDLEAQAQSDQTVNLLLGRLPEHDTLDEFCNFLDEEDVRNSG